MANLRYPIFVSLSLFCLAFVDLISHAQISALEVPMWEGITKTPADIANDEELVRKSLEITNGNRYLAVRYAVRLGWERIGRNDPNGAIRRFNQAWLIMPDFPDIFWGYAIATHIRGDDLVFVERWFAKAESVITGSAQLSADHGRVLEERKMPEKARPYFEAALAIDEDYVPAHIGMIRVAEATGDNALRAAHQKQLDKLTAEENQ